MGLRLLALSTLLVSGGFLASAQLLTLGSSCNPVIDFFPTADQIDPAVPITTTVYDSNGNATLVTCSGDDNCAYPEPVFLKSSQVNYMPKLKTALVTPDGSLMPGSDTSVDDGLLKVVLPPWGEPKLYFTVSSPLLVASSDVTGCIPAAPEVARKLLAAGLNVTEPQQVNVSQPGSWSFTVSVDGGAATQGLKNGKAGVIKLPNDNAAVGDHCAEVRVTISGFQFTSDNGAYAPASIVRKICWYKPVDGHSEAKLTFDMCSQKTFTVNISSIGPLARNLTQNGDQVLMASDDTPALLFRPVVHLFGRKSRNLDGSQVTESFDLNAAMEEGYNFINRYIVLDTNITSDSVLSYVLDENVLEEGYYNLSAKVSMISDFGNLIADTVGKGIIAQTDSYGVEVQGKTEIMSTKLLDFEEVGVQKSATLLSDISSNKANKAIKAGDAITFSWKFVGIKAAQNCYHGDTLIADCVSPLTVPALDVSAAGAKATFIVEFTDVCGSMKKAQYSYTSAGVTADTAVDGATTGIGKPVARTSNASAAGSSFIATIAMAFVSMLMMAAMLH